MSPRRVRVSYPLPACAVAPRAATARSPAGWAGLVMLLRRLATGCGLTLAAGGCSVSLPIAAFIEDPVPTGSIARPDAVLFQALDQEDGRRARAALAVALDPQGNGASVGWGNPQSGAKGTFVATAAPFTDTSRICRAFSAAIEPDVHTERAVDGSACRTAEGEWLVRDARDVTQARAARDVRKLRS